jgi:hypothetical protein
MFCSNILINHTNIFVVVVTFCKHRVKTQEMYSHARTKYLSTWHKIDTIHFTSVSIFIGRLAFVNSTGFLSSSRLLVTDIRACKFHSAVEHRVVFFMIKYRGLNALFCGREGRQGRQGKARLGKARQAKLSLTNLLVVELRTSISILSHCTVNCYCALRTESSYIIQLNLSFQRFYTLVHKAKTFVCTVLKRFVTPESRSI